MKVPMSEARYNDLVYMGLKYGWFQPMFGEGAGPRGYDIRVCMQMGNAEMLKGAGPEAVILWPDEKAPTSHTRVVTVDTDQVLDAMRAYMEQHWMKQRTEGDVWPKLIEAAMGTPEEACAKESTGRMEGAATNT